MTDEPGSDHADKQIVTIDCRPISEISDEQLDDGAVAMHVEHDKLHDKLARRGQRGPTESVIGDP